MIGFWLKLWRGVFSTWSVKEIVVAPTEREMRWTGGNTLRQPKRVTATYFHWILFLDFFSINPIPSRTFVMSYIRRFWRTASVSAAWNTKVNSSGETRNANSNPSLLWPWGERKRQNSRIINTSFWLYLQLWGPTRHLLLPGVSQRTLWSIVLVIFHVYSAFPENQSPPCSPSCMLHQDRAHIWLVDSKI